MSLLKCFTTTLRLDLFGFKICFYRLHFSGYFRRTKLISCSRSLSCGVLTIKFCMHTYKLASPIADAEK